jgi:hypothetical protein
MLQNDELVERLIASHHDVTTTLPDDAKSNLFQTLDTVTT